MDATSSSAETLVPAGHLREFACRRLQNLGVAASDARIVAECLVQTSLWGIDSHGIARLPHYLRRLQSESIETQPEMRFQRTGPCTAQLDGGHGLGIAICHRAMREAVLMAKENGAGVVGCSHSTHCGAIGLYGRQAANEGLIGFAFTHSDAFVVPTNGKYAFVGTNPICIAVPSAAGEPVCVDMATSAVPINRVMNARREGTLLPEGLAFDAEGNPTTDPGRVAGLSPMGEHKGYALGFMIDILCGPLNGMPYGPHIPAMYGDMAARRNLGSLLAAVDPARFAGGAVLAATVAQMADEARRQTPKRADLEVLAPGDPEYRTQRLREKEGIPISAALFAELGLEPIRKP